MAIFGGLVFCMAFIIPAALIEGWQKIADKARDRRETRYIRATLKDTLRK